MMKLEKLSDQDVLNTYLDENAGIMDSDYNFIARILRRSSQNYSAQLDPEDLAKVIMPRHFLCASSRALIFRNIIWDSFSGLDLEATTTKILKDKDYPVRNPYCWRKIQTQKDLIHNKKREGTIFLSQGKPLPLDISWLGMKKRKDRLYLVDGFHRLVAYQMVGETSRNLKFIVMN